MVLRRKRTLDKKHNALGWHWRDPELKCGYKGEVTWNFRITNDLIVVIQDKAEESWGQKS